MTIPADVRARIEDILHQAPVDVAKIAKRFGLAIFQQTLAPGVSGVLLKDPSYGTPSGFVILVNSQEATVRQRFTAAHEIGHFILHRDRIGERVEDNYLLRSEGLSDSIEAQANRFAADLLMPYPLIDQITKKNATTVADLAQFLHVSEIAMGIRLGHPT